MATTKTSTTKRKTTTTKKPAAKQKSPAKTTAKRAAAKTKARKPSAKTTRRPTAKSRAAKAKSFKMQTSDEPFVSLKITVQTLYWLILAGAVLLLGIWVLDISQKVQTIYDEIDKNMIIQRDLDARELELLREQAEKNQ